MTNFFKSIRSHNLLILVCAFFALAILEYAHIKYTFPITEGWWETYAWIYNSGANLYGDVGLKFPPFFVWFINFLQSELGFNFFEKRVVFLIIRLITVYLTYNWLRRYYDEYASLIGAVVSALLIYANPVYLTKDYHIIVALLSIVAINVLTCNGIRIGGRFSNFYLFLLGFICSIILLTKQNVGLFFSVGVFLYFIKTELVDLKTNSLELMNRFSFGVFGFVVPLTISTILIPEWIQIFLGNDSKGSLFVVLFRFVLDSNSLLYILLSIVLYFFYRVWLSLARRNNLLLINSEAYASEFFAIVLSVAFLLAAKISIVIISFSLVWPAIIVVKNNFKFIPDYNSYYLKNIWIIFYSYAYCGTNTAGFNFVSVDYLIAFFVAGTLEIVLIKKINFNLKLKLGVGVFVILIAVAPKLMKDFGYNWWGLKSGGVFQSRSELPYKELDGIYSDVYTSKILNTVERYNLDLEVGERFFSYPSIPILYYLERQPPIGAPVLWFDVSTTNDGEKTVAMLIENKPKLIYWLRPPIGVYKGHFALKKSDPSMIKVDKWIMRSISNGDYEVVDVIPTFDNDYQYETKTFDQSVQIRGQNYEEEFYKKICFELDNCSQDSNKKFNLTSGQAYADFISKSKDILHVDSHVFYVLKSNNHPK